MPGEELFEVARSSDAEFLDLRYLEFPGVVRHVTVTAAHLQQQGCYPNAGAPGNLICEAGQTLVPVPGTAYVDPFCQHSTVAVQCDVKDAHTGQDCQDDLRAVARRAEACLRATGLADRADFAPLLEFFIFDQVYFEQTTNAAAYRVESREGHWRQGRAEPDNLGTQFAPGDGPGQLPPSDSLHNLRSEMSAALAACGVPVGSHCRSAATGGHGALDLQPAPLLQMADRLLTAKYVIRNVAARHGKVATFMPKPLFGDAGSGMPTRLALCKGTQPLPGGTPGGPLSDVHRWAVGGLLAHTPSLLALVCPTTNSFRRFVPGSTAPARLTYSHGDPASVVAVPLCCPASAPDWIEFRAPDACCVPHLALPAILLAALDGIEQKLDPGPATDQPGALPGALQAPAPARPASLDEALQALEADHTYLLRGAVFTESLIRRWIEHKRNEAEALRARPHPYEFCLYFRA